MDTIKSFKGYGKVEEVEQHAFQKKTRRRLVLIGVSAVILIAVVIGVGVGAAAVRVRSSGSGSGSSTSLKAVCSVTKYPDACLSALSNSTTTDPAKIFLLSLQVALSELTKLVAVPTAHISKLNNNNNNNLLVHKALEDCADVLSDSVDRLEDSISSASTSSLTTTHKDDLRTWLSAALTDQETCLDGLAEIDGTAELVAEIRSAMNTSAELVSNSLAIVTKLFGLRIPNHRRSRRLLGAAEIRLLQETSPTPDVVVAKDGTGNYTTVAAAVVAAPIKSKKRHVIYVKTGKYVEKVVLPKNIWNVMIYGDGMTKTVISGSLNFIDGTPTFSTATFTAQGKGFIGKDIGFENTAGAEKHQAVAFRSGSDQSLMYRCMFDGYQDTLYTHSNRQLYLGCTVTGTIDFIFGNAAAVFQDCTIQPRQPLAKQFNTITAQGKKDPNQNTGISIHKCNLTPLGNLIAPTYLGRPWKDFSTTLIMQSTIGSFLNPLGWIEWVQGVDPPTSIFYAEYQNSGPGADVSNRVKWVGYQPTITFDQASKYTVDTFIDGNAWLPSADVTYQSSL